MLEDKNGKYVSITSKRAIKLPMWNYIVAVRDRAAGKLRLYINGKLEAEADDVTGDISGDLPLHLGYDQYAGGYLWGLVDEVRISKGALRRLN